MKKCDYFLRRSILLALVLIINSYSFSIESTTVDVSHNTVYTSGNGVIEFLLANEVEVANLNPAPGDPCDPAIDQPTIKVTQPDCENTTGSIVFTAPENAGGTSYSIVGINPQTATKTNLNGVFNELAPGEYEVYVSVGYCSSTPIQVIIKEFEGVVPALPTLTVTQPDCENATGSILFTTPENSAGISYSIFGTNPVSSIETNLYGEFTDLAPGDYEVFASVDACNTQTIPVTIKPFDGEVPTLPEVEVTQPYCGDSIGTIIVTSPENAAGISYTIFGTNPSSPMVTNLNGEFTGLTPGEYEIFVSVDDCNSPTLPITIEILSEEVPEISVIQPNCEDSTGTVIFTDPKNGAGISYTIFGTNPSSPMETNLKGEFTGLAVGDYEVFVSVDDCNSKTIPVSISMDEWLADDCDGDGVTNGDEIADGTDPYNPCDFNIDSQSVDPSQEWLNSDCDEDGVTNGDEVFGNSDPLNPCDPTPCGVIVPDAFTPNGDGNNDTWMIDGIEKYPNNEITIFDRWGNVVYDAKGYLNDWDGTSTSNMNVGGGELPTGTYYYVIDTKDEDAGVLKGYVYIQR